MSGGLAVARAPRLAAAAGLVAAVALGVGAAALAGRPRLLLATLGALAAGAALVIVARRIGALGLWLTLLLGSILAGGLGAIAVSGQSGHILWADAVLGAGVIGVAWRRRLVFEWPRAPFLDALWPFLAWSALGLVLSRDPLTGLSELKEWVAAAVVAVAAANYARDRRGVRVLLGAVALVGAAVGLHMVYVTVTSPFGPIVALTMKLVDLPWGRSNYLAGLLILAIPIALGLLVETRSGLARVAWGGALLAALAGLAVSSSKGAILALLVALLVAHGAERRAPAALRWGALALLAAVAAVFSTGALQEVWKYRLQQHSLDYSAGERMDLYRLAWQQFLSHPLFGIGLGNFEVVSNRLHGVDTVPHNLETGFLCEIGIPGLLLAGAWVLALGRTAWATRTAGLGTRDGALGLALWAAFVGFVVHNQFESTIYGQQYKMMLAVVAAATWGLGRRPAAVEVRGSPGG